VEAGRPSDFARLGGQAAADDQVDTAAGAHFVQQHGGLQRSLGDFVAPFLVAVTSAVSWLMVRTITSPMFIGHVQLDRQGAGVFHGVEEDRGDLGADADAAVTLVRDVRDVVPVNHSTELVADLRLEPVPTTSPT
jgi:hypothetical protein